MIFEIFVSIIAINRTKKVAKNVPHNEPQGMLRPYAGGLRPALLCNLTQLVALQTKYKPDCGMIRMVIVFSLYLPLSTHTTLATGWYIFVFPFDTPTALMMTFRRTASSPEGIERGQIICTPRRRRHCRDGTDRYPVHRLK